MKTQAEYVKIVRGLIPEGKKPRVVANVMKKQPVLRVKILRLRFPKPGGYIEFMNRADGILDCLVSSEMCNAAGGDLKYVGAYNVWFYFQLSASEHLAMLAAHEERSDRWYATEGKKLNIRKGVKR